ncbi:MAG: Sec-independent protein translocase protein TatB [Gammaproteobacteria bacterium]
MFDIGFWELAVIGVVALLVVGPERMPGLIRTAGQWAGQVQRLARDLRREIEREAQTDEFRKLNQEFLAEDRRLKDSVRETTAAPRLTDPPAPPGEDDTPDAAEGGPDRALAAEPAAGDDVDAGAIKPGTGGGTDATPSERSA